MTVFDVADWFLHKKGFTLKQIQKLCYYAQAWHLALLNKPLFYENFQAWIHGAVCPDLHDKFKTFQWLKIPRLKGKCPIFSNDSMQVLSAVYHTYSKFTGEQLESINRSELPWLLARGNLFPTEPSRNVIDLNVMKNFYVNEYKKNQGD